jgi:hypothetical protein
MLTAISISLSLRHQPSVIHSAVVSLAHLAQTSVGPGIGSLLRRSDRLTGRDRFRLARGEGLRVECGGQGMPPFRSMPEMASFHYLLGDAACQYPFSVCPAVCPSVLSPVPAGCFLDHSMAHSPDSRTGNQPIHPPPRCRNRPRHDRGWNLRQTSLTEIGGDLSMRSRIFEPVCVV